jgi:uncharacterized protein
MLEPLLRGTPGGSEFVDAPIEPSWIEDGDPKARAVILSATDDRLAFAVLWECAAGRFTWRYSCDETIYLLDGGCVLRQRGQPEMRLGPGDSAHFSRGAVVTWTIDSHVRKIGFFKNAAPRPVSLAIRLAKGGLKHLRARLRGGARRGPAFGPA